MNVTNTRAGNVKILRNTELHLARPVRGLYTFKFYVRCTYIGSSDARWDVYLGSFYTNFGSVRCVSWIPYLCQKMK